MQLTSVIVIESVIPLASEHRKAAFLQAWQQYVFGGVVDSNVFRLVQITRRILWPFSE